MRQPAVFNVQFFRPAVDGVAQVAASCQLSTHPAGTPGSNLATYTDEAGGTPNTNPIVLDADGRCALWLDPAQEYLLRLLDTVANGSGLLEEFDDVVAAAPATGVVTSVNGETGAVTLDPADIAYSGPALAWLTASDVQEALDQIAGRANAVPASSVSVADVGGIFTGTNVEDVLEEIGEGVLPDPTGHEGKGLRVNPSTGAVEWSDETGEPTGTIGAAGSVTFPGGLILKWGTTVSIPADSANNAIAFPVAFPTACYVVTMTAASANGVGSAEKYSAGLHNISASGFQIDNDASASVFTWFAIGT